MSEQQIIQMLESGKRDLIWFESNLDRLVSEYNNKFIAFHEGNVIDSDPDLDSLMRKLKKKRIDFSSVIIEFVSDVKYLL
jgi:hypothetical protein